MGTSSFQLAPGTKYRGVHGIVEGRMLLHVLPSPLCFQECAEVL